MSVAIFGAGILGSCTALELADRGHHVVLFERNAEPMSEASLYNEGKLHLGFVYAADSSFRTAERMIRGAMRFTAILERWVPRSALRMLPSSPFDYVVHRDTMVDVPAIEAHFERVAQAERAERLRSGLRGIDTHRDPERPAWRRLAPDELAARYDSNRIVAGYETCEIAVDTWLLAEHVRTAVRSHPRIELLDETRVITATDRTGGGYDVIFEADGTRRRGPFEAVVNALWANRPAIDGRYGVPPRRQWINRRKLGVNLQCGAAAQVPSFTVMLGPFGDVVAYRSGRVYLSWYPACMIGTSLGAEETDWSAVARRVDGARISRETIDALAEICPAARALQPIAGSEIVVNGGTIYALGHTDIDDPASRLHERIDTGIEGQGAYLSVDTAKFTLGPVTAVDTADRIAAVVRRSAVA
jgi:glycine/D-amino acid oxidase-like deaminating enzyme